MISSMIFFPEKQLDYTPKDFRLPFEELAITTQDGIKLHGWFLPSPEEKGVILFLHGNAGNISHRLFKVDGWVKRGISVLLLDYRGYGQSEGAIRHEEDLTRDALAGYEWLTGVKKVPPSRIILYGESIGGHPALKVAAQVAPVPAAVILESPFTSAIEMAKKHYPFVPGFLLKDFEFSNREVISKIRTPVFLMHGSRDEICPIEMGRTLYELAPGPKELFEVPGGDHNDLPGSAKQDYWDRPRRFVSAYLK